MEDHGSAKIGDNERTRAVEVLESSYSDFVKLVERLPEHRWSTPPVEDEWSVSQVAEHLRLCEEGMYRAAERALSADPNPEWASETAGKDQELEALMMNRERRASAPEIVYPKDPSPQSSVIDEIGRGRRRSIEFVRTTELPLKQHTFPHPFFGPLSAYQWLLCLGLHNHRHNDQIREILGRI